MLRPPPSRGGVLSQGEQSQLHEQMRGVGYRTEAQQAEALAKLVRPFKSALVGGQQQGHMQEQRQPYAAPAPPPAPSSHRPSSASTATRRAPSSNRPSSATSHKKASISTSASAARPAASSVAPPVPEPPAWVALAVHKPDRPNAPSQQTEEQRRAAHKVGGVRAAAAGSRAGGTQPQQRVPKSHKVVNRQYADPYATAHPAQRDAAHAEVSIERHARPLIVHPPPPSVPLSESMSTRERRAALERAKQAQPQPVVKFVPIGHVVGVRHVPAAAAGSQGQQQTNGLGLQQDGFDQPQQYHHSQWQHALPAHSQQPQSRPPPSSSPLSTPSYDAFAEAPNPYSDHFEPHQRQRQPQQHPHYQPNGAGATPWDAAHQQPPSHSHPSMSLHSDMLHRPDAPTAASPTAAGADAAARRSHDDNLCSPTPARSRAPQPSQHSAVPFPSSDTLAAPPSPSHGAQAALKTEANGAHTPRPNSPQGGQRQQQQQQQQQQPTTAHFTPNPHAKERNDREDQGTKVSVADAELQTESPRTQFHPTSSSSTAAAHSMPPARPADLLPLSKPLYPARDAEMDPHRALMASLRGPRLRYEPSPPPPSPPLPAPENDTEYEGAFTTPLTPKKGSSAHSTSSDDSDASAAASSTASASSALSVTESLQALVDQRAAQRIELQRVERAKWAEKLAKLKQASSGTVVVGSSSVGLGLGREWEQKEKDAEWQHRSVSHLRRPQDDAQTAPAPHSPSPTPADPLRPHPRNAEDRSSSPNHAPQQQQSQQPQRAHGHSAVIGGRTSDPVVVTHANRGPRGPAQRTAVTFAASTAADSAAAAPAAAATPAVRPSSTSTLPPAPSLPPTRRFVLGSTNAAKLNAVRSVVERVFGTTAVAPAEGAVHPQSLVAQQQQGVPWRPAEVVGLSVPSGVRDQPLSGAETIQGAVARARAALAADPLAEYGVGVEGGLEQVAPPEGQSVAPGAAWYQAGWVAVVDRQGRVGTGSSARFQVADHVASELCAGGIEMADLVDRLSGQSGVRHKAGFMGLVTNGLLPRAECYAQGVLFALAPFISPPVYWDAKQAEAEGGRR